MQFKIINIGENSKELRLNFIKNARTKSKMVLSGFTQMFSEEKSYIADIPAMTLFFDSYITEVNNNIAVKSVNIYDIKDSAITNSLKTSENLNDLLKLKMLIKLSSQNECLDVDISGINKNNKAIVTVADAIKHQYEETKTFPNDPVGIGGSWSLILSKDIYEYTYLFTLRERTNSIIKYDYILNYFSNKNQLLTKETDITAYKDLSGSAVANVSVDIATGDYEAKSKSFSTAVSELKDIGGKIVTSEQSILSSLEFVYDSVGVQTNINDILNNIKDDKLPKLYS